MSFFNPSLTVCIMYIAEDNECEPETVQPERDDITGGVCAEFHVLDTSHLLQGVQWETHHGEQVLLHPVSRPALLHAVRGVPRPHRLQEQVYPHRIQTALLRCH